MKIGIFGGSFDPPHLGHLIVAEHVRVHLGLDRILFVPAATAPHKLGREVTDAGHRLRMLERALFSNPDFQVSDEEAVRGGVSYTIETLAALRTRHPGAELFLMIGADNALEFDSWKDPGGIRSSARIVVMHRPGVKLDLKRLRRNIPDALVVDVPAIDIASRIIRKRVAEGVTIRYLVPDGVLEYIREHGLYR